MCKVLFTLVHFLVLNSWASKIVLRDNGYENVQIAIDPDVPEDANLLTEIQSLFASASPYLHQAMRERAYFRNLTILIPNTWNDLPEYEDVSSERFQDADFRIQEQNPSYGDNPYTKQPRGCGEAGDYIHLTPDYVLDNGIERERNWGDSGRVLVHEFTHLRYGVFDEYGFDDSVKFPVFYVNDNGGTKVTGCTDDVSGVLRHGETLALCRVDPTTRLPEKKCRFFADAINGKAKASIMFLQHVRSVTSFCEVDASDPSLAHNRDAPNLQNKMCNGLGAWDVISQHVDFINGTNPPVPYPNDTVLNIKLAYQRSTAPASGSSHVVLVMDVSGSMSSRIFRLGQTASKFIYDIIPDQYHLGMSTFSSSGVRWRPIVTIANKTVRSKEVNGLPTSAGGGTSIGGGINAALQMLRAEGDGVLEGSSLIVITDGQENSSPYIADIFNDVKSSGIIVHSMAYGRLASDNLLTLTDETGGIYEYYTESSISTALDGFLGNLEAALARDRDVLPVTVDRRMITLTVTDPVVSGYVPIDSNLGYQTEFFFTCPQKSNIKVNLTGPSSEYTPTSPEYSYDAMFKVIRIKLATSEPGNWTYQISRESGFANEVVAVWIRSRPRPKQFPITIKAYMNKLQVTFPAITVVYVEVTQGRSPILEALVTAIAERPSKDPASVTLLDNGQGADTVRGDGIYSAYFTQFTGDGKYSVEVFVVDGGSASIVVNRKLPGGAYSILKPNPKPTLTRVDPFKRTGRAGGFVVTHYVPDDIIPPTRITDLLLSSFDFDNREVTLQWTAPGDDFDTGRADVFELRYGQSYVSLRTEFHNMTLLNDTFLLSGNMTPPLAGNKVTVTVRTPPFASSDVMVFGIRAIDKAGNVGDLSNLVAIARQPADEFDETGNFILDFGEPTNMRTTKEPDLQTTTEPDWQTTPAMGRANPSLDSLVLVYIHLISVCIISGLTLVSGV